MLRSLSCEEETGKRLTFNLWFANRGVWSLHTKKHGISPCQTRGVGGISTSKISISSAEIRLPKLTRGRQDLGDDTVNFSNKKKRKLQVNTYDH